MAEQEHAVQDPEGGPPIEEHTGAKGPLIPPILVRFSIIGGILAVLAVGAIFLVTDVIAPRIHTMGQPAKPSAAPKEKLPEPGQVYTVSDLVINPANSGGRRYLKVAAAIEVRDLKKAKELELRAAQVRDLLIRDLSARTLEELTDPAAKEEMRQTMVDELNEIMGAGQISHLYFTEYVVQ